MADFLSRAVINFFENSGAFWNSLSASSRLPFIITDILVVTLLFYWLYVLIRETRAWRIFLGLVFILLAMLLSKLLGLTTLNWIFRNFITVLVVAIPVVFQPELRGALEKLGRIRLRDSTSKKGNVDEMIDAIVNACGILARSEIGALIVIQRRTGLKDYAESGTILNADISSNLIVNLFQKKAPLHDGAIIVVANKIKAAGCLLPIEESRLKQDLGTRHQAGISLSKQTDALVIIVSEEKGTISVAQEGKLQIGLSIFDLKQILIAKIKGSHK